MEIFGLLVLLITAGAVAGLTAGLFGNGGGFAVVPALVLLFSILDIESETLIFVAVGTSLACIIFSSARALIRAPPPLIKFLLIAIIRFYS